MVNEIMLRHAAPVVLEEVTFVAIHVHAPAGLPIKVSLGVDADEEQDYELGIGDTFRVRDEVWVLDRVENHASQDYRVFLRKAE